MRMVQIQQVRNAQNGGGVPVSTLCALAFPVASRLLMTLFTHRRHFQFIASRDLKIPNPVAYSHSYCLASDMHGVLSLSNFPSYLAPLVLNLCCVLFTVPRATLLCCIIEHLMPFDDAVENLRMLPSTAQEGFVKDRWQGN